MAPAPPSHPLVDSLRLCLLQGDDAGPFPPPRPCVVLHKRRQPDRVGREKQEVHDFRLVGGPFKCCTRGGVDLRPDSKIEVEGEGLGDNERPTHERAVEENDAGRVQEMEYSSGDGGGETGETQGRGEAIMPSFQVVTEFLELRGSGVSDSCGAIDGL